MKQKLFLLAAVCSAMLSSCGSTSYYQLYEVTPVSEIKNTDNELVYEDKNCKVSYNLWSDSGNAGFKFYNKTDENISIDLSNSFFILNDVAYDYYKNRVFTEETSESLSRAKKSSFSGVAYTNSFLGAIAGMQSVQEGATHTSGSSIAVTEQQTIIVPPKTSKYIYEYSVNSTLIKNCDLLKYPTKSKVKAISFSKESSPLSFSNRISYTVGNNNAVKIENSFYVSQISNHPNGDFVSFKQNKECDESVSTEMYNYFGADKFYINYYRNMDTAKY